jgi:hypothetical protein
VCFGQSLLEKSRSRFETVDLINSIDPADRGTEEMIHDGERGRIRREDATVDI